MRVFRTNECLNASIPHKLGHPTERGPYRCDMYSCGPTCFTLGTAFNKCRKPAVKPPLFGHIESVNLPSHFDIAKRVSLTMNPTDP